ncbi:MAG TPA: hypothetical protein VFX16_18095 [Pseudonocardiaceae bacterium]|nr:hypothetical protein [Pseudonocardiaceae bacterium]
MALAASKVDDSVRPDLRLANFVAVIRRIKRRFPVIVWQQGVLGEAAVDVAQRWSAGADSSKLLPVFGRASRIQPQNAIVSRTDE